MTTPFYDRRAFLALTGGATLAALGCQPTITTTTSRSSTMPTHTSAIVRPAAERGTTDIGWLDSRHSFSFGGYRDPQHMGFGPLRVINDDRVAKDGGFGTHPHNDMEIISYVVDGALEHRDSLGTGSIIKPGDIQMMRAGTGITHSEFNAADQTTRFLQIWIIPDQSGLEPGYQQIHRPGSETPDDFRLLVSPDGSDGSVQIAQDANLRGLAIHAGKSADLHLPTPRAVWVQVVTGTIAIDGQELGEGDGLALQQATGVSISASADADVLVFDLPAMA